MQIKLIKNITKIKNKSNVFKNKTSWKSEMNLSSTPINDFQEGFKMNTNKRVVP